MPGKGRTQITGKLGDVMQESVKAAKSFRKIKMPRIWNYSTTL